MSKKCYDKSGIRIDRGHNPEIPKDIERNPDPHGPSKDQAITQCTRPKRKTDIRGWPKGW